MKIASIFFAFLISSAATWTLDLNESKTKAKAENKLILLNFCGSDWCGPCIKLKKNYFDTEAFQAYAAEKLVLLKADFPRKKQNQPLAEQIKKNEAMAEAYNKEGKFPFTVLIDGNGKVLKSWDGLPKV